MSKFQAGDRIAYAAKFLKNTGLTGSSAQRRGTYLGAYDHMPASHSRVKWDDMEENIARGEGQYADPEYVAEIRARGQIVGNGAIAKLGSARFALTCID